MSNRQYRMKLNGTDAEALTLLKHRIPEHWPSLQAMREAGRAIELLFPGVKPEYISIQPPKPVLANRVRTL